MFNTRNHRTKDLLNIWKLSLMCKYLAAHVSKVMIKNIRWLNNTKVPNMVISLLLSAWFCLHNVVGRGAGVQQVRTGWCRAAQGAGDLSTGSYPNTELLTVSPPRPPAAGSLTGPANFFPSSYRKLLHNTSLHLQTLQHTTQKIFRADADACLLRICQIYYVIVIIFSFRI